MCWTRGELFLRHGPPEHIRSDNGPEIATYAMAGTIESEDLVQAAHGRIREFENELLAREIFYDLREAKVLIEN